ncbi:MAG: elongation factor P [Desulfohalobiaceae bacterium]|nr:elongation factor P [Desulfohalobiaceae bacterium]
MYSTGDIRNGLKIELNGQPYEILDFLHAKSGRGGATVWTKLRNLLTGGVVEHTFRSGEKIARPDLESRDMQYLYRDGDLLAFMDFWSYEQVEARADTLSGKAEYLSEGQQVKVVLYREEIVDVNLPNTVVLEVTDTEPGIRGDTVTGATKPATLETGLVVNVPLFIEVGHRIKVDTRSGEYLGRE